MNEKSENQIMGGINGYVIYVPLLLLWRRGGEGVGSQSIHFPVKKIEVITQKNLGMNSRGDTEQAVG